MQTVKGAPGVGRGRLELLLAGLGLASTIVLIVASLRGFRAFEPFWRPGEAVHVALRGGLLALNLVASARCALAFMGAREATPELTELSPGLAVHTRAVLAAFAGGVFGIAVVTPALASVGEYKDLLYVALVAPIVALFAPLGALLRARRFDLEASPDRSRAAMFALSSVALLIVGVMGYGLLRRYLTVGTYDVRLMLRIALPVSCAVLSAWLGAMAGFNATGRARLLGLTACTVLVVLLALV